MPLHVISIELFTLNLPACPTHLAKDKYNKTLGMSGINALLQYVTRGMAHCHTSIDAI